MFNRWFGLIIAAVMVVYISFISYAIYTKQGPSEVVEGLVNEVTPVPEPIKLSLEEADQLFGDAIGAAKQGLRTELQLSESAPLASLVGSRVSWEGKVRDVQLSASGSSVVVLLEPTDNKNETIVFAYFPRPHPEQLMWIHKGEEVEIEGTIGEIKPPLVGGYGVFLRNCEIVQPVNGEQQ